MKPKRILQAIRQGQVGGGESHVLELVANIDRTLFEPVVLSFTDGPMVKTLRKKGITTRVLHTEKPFNYKIWPLVKALMIEEKIDLVHAHGTRALSNVFKAAKQLDLPLIYTVHGWSFHPDQFFLVRRLRELSEKYLTRKADLTICVSKSNEDLGVKRLNLDDSMVIHNAIDLQRFNPRRNLSNVRAELGFNADHFVIGFIARITGQKDPFTMLNAMQILIKQNKKIRLLMVGDGNLKHRVMEKAKAMGLQSHIVFQPFRNDIPAVLNAIDLYCLPSLWEGFPIGILEAMAMRKPVVASPVDGTSELIVNLQTGVLVEQQKPKALAETILNLYNDEILRTTISQKAFQYVRTHFGIRELVRKLEKVYGTYFPAVKSNQTISSPINSVSC